MLTDAAPEISAAGYPVGGLSVALHCGGDFTRTAAGSLVAALPFPLALNIDLLE